MSAARGGAARQHQNREPTTYRQWPIGRSGGQPRMEVLLEEDHHRQALGTLASIDSPRARRGNNEANRFSHRILARSFHSKTSRATARAN